MRKYLVLLFGVLVVAALVGGRGVVALGLVLIVAGALTLVMTVVEGR